MVKYKKKATIKKEKENEKEIVSETKVQEKKAVVIEKKPAQNDMEDEFFEDDDRGEQIPTFNYPFMRRMPTIRIQPIAANLEIALDDIPTTKKEEDTTDLYKPLPEKNYSLNQKYEIPGGGASYDSITPKQISSSSPSISSGFSGPMDSARGFGNQSGTPGYPGQDTGERKYDSGLERQTADQDKRRRDM